ncbi:hypothetical protein Vadar_033162 [Vaccinium darrowii]|uniref:Uncharacterized protein n=1 Tax=Vaccinium darrowii TaxID=229202 RepID=A0ACB7XUY6_9ERIC|nr:hypothetical protein Vadar_033162 [Vaccinium darrowii]
MCDSVKTLFRKLGVTNSTVYVLDEESTPWGKEIKRALMGSIGSLPVVFIGGELIGDRDRVIKRHSEGKLVKLLEKAGAFNQQR